MKARKVVWVLINVSYYHEARWAAFSNNLDYDPIIVEIANKDAGFAQLEKKGEERIKRVTLFNDRNWRQVSGWQRRQALWHALDKLNPDVVCINGWSIGGALASLLWVLRNHCRSVIFSDSNVHDRSRNPGLERVKKHIVQFADAALVSGTAAQTYMAKLGMPRDRVFMGYDVVDNAHFSSKAEDGINSAIKLSPAQLSPFFLAVGRFEAKKNHLRLLEAYAEYRRRMGQMAWPLVLLGDGRLRPELEVQQIKLGLKSCVFMPGFKKYEDLPAWYRNAGCFIHPSTTEQWGLVVNEAMASGLPVLVSDRCGCALDLVQNGINGFTFDPDRLEQLAVLMCRVAHETEQSRIEMGYASEKIIADWGLQRFAAGLTDAVESVVQRPRNRAGLLDSLLLRALSYR